MKAEGWHHSLKLTVYRKRRPVLLSPAAPKNCCYPTMRYLKTIQDQVLMNCNQYHVLCSCHTTRATPVLGLPSNAAAQLLLALDCSKCSACSQNTDCMCKCTSHVFRPEITDLTNRQAARTHPQQQFLHCHRCRCCLQQCHHCHWSHHFWSFLHWQCCHCCYHRHPQHHQLQHCHCCQNQKSPHQHCCHLKHPSSVNVIDHPADWTTEWTTELGNLPDFTAPLTCSDNWQDHWVRVSVCWQDMVAQKLELAALLTRQPNSTSSSSSSK